MNCPIRRRRTHPQRAISTMSDIGSMYVIYIRSERI